MKIFAKTFPTGIRDYTLHFVIANLIIAYAYAIAIGNILEHLKIILLFIVAQARPSRDVRSWFGSKNFPVLALKPKPLALQSEALALIFVLS